MEAIGGPPLIWELPPRGVTEIAVVFPDTDAALQGSREEGAVRREAVGAGGSLVF